MLELPIYLIDPKDIKNWDLKTIDEFFSDQLLESINLNADANRDSRSILFNSIFSNNFDDYLLLTRLFNWFDQYINDVKNNKTSYYRECVLLFLRVPSLSQHFYRNRIYHRLFDSLKYSKDCDIIESIFNKKFNDALDIYFQPEDLVYSWKLLKNKNNSVSTTKTRILELFRKRITKYQITADLVPDIIDMIVENNSNPLVSDLIQFLISKSFIAKLSSEQIQSLQCKYLLLTSLIYQQLCNDRVSGIDAIQNENYEYQNDDIQQFLSIVGKDKLEEQSKVILKECITEKVEAHTIKTLINLLKHCHNRDWIVPHLQPIYDILIKSLQMNKSEDTRLLILATLINNHQMDNKTCETIFGIVKSPISKTYFYASQQHLMSTILKSQNISNPMNYINEMVATFNPHDLISRFCINKSLMSPVYKAVIDQMSETDRNELIKKVKDLSSFRIAKLHMLDIILYLEPDYHQQLQFIMDIAAYYKSVKSSFISGANIDDTILMKLNMITSHIQSQNESLPVEFRKSIDLVKLRDTYSNILLTMEGCLNIAFKHIPNLQEVSIIMDASIHQRWSYRRHIDIIKSTVGSDKLKSDMPSLYILLGHYLQKLFSHFVQCNNSHFYFLDIVDESLPLFPVSCELLERYLYVITNYWSSSIVMMPKLNIIPIQLVKIFEYLKNHSNNSIGIYGIYRKFIRTYLFNLKTNSRNYLKQLNLLEIVQSSIIKQDILSIENVLNISNEVLYDIWEYWKLDISIASITISVLSFDINNFYLKKRDTYETFLNSTAHLFGFLYNLGPLSATVNNNNNINNGNCKILQLEKLPSLIFRKILKYVVFDKLDIPKLALLSKYFYKEMKKLISNTKLNLSFLDKFKNSIDILNSNSIYQNPYHLDYKWLQSFHYKNVLDIFYNLTSLNIDIGAQQYSFKQPMPNLQSLYMSFSIEKYSKLHSEFLMSILNKAPNLSMVLFSYKMSYNITYFQCVYPILKKLKSMEKENQLFLKTIATLNLEEYEFNEKQFKTYANACRKIIITQPNHYNYWDYSPPTTIPSCSTKLVEYINVVSQGNHKFFKRLRIVEILSSVEYTFSPVFIPILTNIKYKIERLIVKNSHTLFLTDIMKLIPQMLNLQSLYLSYNKCNELSLLEFHPTLKFIDLGGATNGIPTFIPVNSDKSHFVKQL
ncbi:Cell differentiation protein rcd1 [Tieghemostelium lacteum]|uniref:Cell differentiation protein rcd1 n=1 Tax=Tieghemostelium lacteum TaxID=361077 RepID=A0A151Z8V6_TIELA|nr:Cell differentiation protein rcd1 [Tieghemostelium lacteum]|eukprot:KYQ90390.1 Cell differentiation protein rcd1 [Tieghemostelium lacteum]